MSRAILWHPLTRLAGAALAAFVILRLTVTAWVYNQVPADTRARLLAPWILDLTLSAVLLIATITTYWWLTNRARRQERERAHLHQLAQLGLLAGGLAHEIRNTLNAMHSQIALLRKQLPPESEPAFQRAGQFECAVVELEELVSEFLAFARPAKSQLENVDLVGLIAELLDFVALDLEQGKVTVVTELDPNLLPVYADVSKLKRALLNLFINARQAMSKGGTLSVRARLGGHGRILIEVTDTGCGIPEEDWPHIFETFFSTKSGGTGLGLAVVKRTVEDFGGRVTFDSEIGRGTTFRISLPTVERGRGRLE